MRLANAPSVNMLHKAITPTDSMTRHPTPLTTRCEEPGDEEEEEKEEEEEEARAKRRENNEI